MICCCIERGRSSQTRSAGVGELSRKVAPALALSSISWRVRKVGWWQATKLASFSPIR